jgi:hypothetical protein
MNVHAETHYGSGAVATRKWLRNTARKTRRLRALIGTFICVYSVFLCALTAGQWLPLGALTTCLGIASGTLTLIVSIANLSALWRNRIVATVLTTDDAVNIANIGAVASLARFPQPHSIRSRVASIVKQLIPMLTAPVLLDMSPGDRRGLYEYMVCAEPTICQAILSACEQAQDTLALPFVRRLVKRLRSRGGSDVLAQATRCLESLETHRIEPQSQYLLRATAQRTVNELLRPAAESEVAPEELLRASSGNDPTPAK